jgi:CheY-like chemotaxis protein/two-component sensor histidine kinase
VTDQTSKDRTVTTRCDDERTGVFLATLAHELRNPLASIHMALEVMKRAGDRVTLVKEARAIAERQVRLLARLVDDLLDVSRVSVGKLELRAETTDLQSILDRVLEMTRPKLDAAGHRLTLDAPCGSVQLRVDPIRLSQAIANLLDNAATFTAPGGTIRLAAAAMPDALVLVVEDNGAGIPEHMLPKVYDAFFQVDPTGGHGGLGIGLTLARSLIELHGGAVHVESPGPGQGSTVTVSLPLPGLHDHANPPHDGVAAQPQRPRKVLVVDDDQAVADSLSMVLTLAGHEVETAYDGVTALEAAQRQRPEIVLMDIGMPGMDGYSVAREFRRRADLREALLVAVTGWGADEDRWRTREAGFDIHLVKPVDYETLETLLRGEPPVC